MYWSISRYCPGGSYLFSFLFLDIYLHISLKMSIFVYELRQGLNSLSINPLTLQQTKNIDL